MRIDAEPFTVIGVMPPSFRFPTVDVEAWIPHVLREQMFADRNNNYLQVVARLRSGVSLDQSQRELVLIAKRLEAQYPKENKDVAATVMGLRDDLSERARLLVIALCGAALCILLLACANLASLFLARGSHRASELAVRAALGAGRERLVRQLVTESIAIAGLGGLLGIFAASAGLPLLAQLVPSSLPMSTEATLDLRLLGVATLFVLVTGLAFGLAPALRAGRSSALDALRSGARTGGGRTQRLRATLVIVEVTVSVVLLITSGLLIRAMWQIQSTNPGFAADHLLMLRTALPATKYDSLAARKQFYGRVLDDVRGLPGVTASAYTTGVPLVMRGRIWPVTLRGEELVRGAQNSASLRFITPQYFATMGIPMRRGRDVAESDTREQPYAAVVSESFAKRWWPGEDPVGKRFTMAFDERTVIGVVGDVKVRGPISDVRILNDVLADDTTSRMTQLRLLGALSVLALLIAGLGIHGLLSFSVSKRSQELGVRRALGAQATGILTLILREGLALAGIGILMGVAVANVAARGMGALLAGIHPNDAMTIGTAAGLCLAVAVLGCILPAMRAARVDPLSALRAE